MFNIEVLTDVTVLGFKYQPLNLIHSEKAHSNPNNREHTDPAQHGV